MLDCHAAESEKGRAGIVMRMLLDGVGVECLPECICRVCLCRNKSDNFVAKVLLLCCRILLQINCTDSNNLAPIGSAAGLFCNLIFILHLFSSVWCISVHALANTL